MNSGSVGATRFSLRQTPPDRFLGILNQTQPQIDAGDEFSEDDVLWTREFAESESNHNSPHQSHCHHHQSHPKGFSLSAKSGILAALPEPDRIHDRSVFNHKASSPRVSSTSSSPSSVSSTRIMIPLVPKKPSTPERRNSPVVQHSAPVNVPMLSEAMRRWREIREFDDIDDVIEELNGSEILPPHELVEAKESPALANSVLEGNGRTLKGRDLRQVRNAIWRKTGFLD